MKIILSLTVLILMSLYNSSVHAGKVDDVQGAIKNSCRKDIPNDDALRLVKRLFLSCVPGSKIDIEGCQVSCLKQNSGVVVGQ